MRQLNVTTIKSFSYNCNNIFVSDVQYFQKKEMKFCLHIVHFLHDNMLQKKMDLQVDAFSALLVEAFWRRKMQIKGKK